MHFLPYYAPQIGELAAQFPNVPVILDHLGRVGEGTPADFTEVLRLAKLPNVYMKYSNAKADMRPMVRRIYDAFGADRMMWGYFGHDRAGFDKEVELFEMMFDHLSEADQEKIRGRNALKLFRWQT
jgi:predicted TIM-barrel fold metal-dependent hydrolase